MGLFGLFYPYFSSFAAVHTPCWERCSLVQNNHGWAFWIEVFWGKILRKLLAGGKSMPKFPQGNVQSFIYIIRYIWDVWSIDGQKEWGRGDEKESRQRLPLMESLRLSCLFLRNESLYVCLFCRNILQNLQQMSPNHVDGGDEQALVGSMHIAQRRSERNHVEVGITL